MLRSPARLAGAVTLALVVGSFSGSGPARAAIAPAALALPAAATCTSSTGPGIPPPTAVPSGTPGFHASWYGQSGYMTVCSGETATATVAMYNSGSAGWVGNTLGQTAYLGTWSPSPGQDQPSTLGGDGTNGSPSTGWPRYNRVAVQPAAYVGPNQVAWFQFTVKAPTTPGSYAFYIRPLIEGAQWMEDYGIYWQVTVPDPAAPSASCASATGTLMPEQALITDVSVGMHDGYDRIVFDLASRGSPAVGSSTFAIAQTTPPYLQDASGLPLSIAGDPVLKITLRGATAARLDGTSSYTGSRDFVPGFPILRELKASGDFEATSSWLVGLNGAACVQTQMLSNPVRLVIDLRSAPGAANGYVDDRSTPERVLRSFASAIDRREYLRAYSYWETPSVLGTFDEFSRGYAQTDSITISPQRSGSDAGAGQLYSTIGALLTAPQTDGTTQLFSACYTFHLAQPANQTSPPFQPLAIRNAVTRSLSATSELSAGLDADCSSANGRAPTGPGAAPVPGTDLVTAAIYLDDRSTGQQVVRSYYNSINRREFSRAYGAWEAGSAVAPFAQFSAGFADTSSVDLTTGVTIRNAGAGQLYDSVPTGLVSRASDGTMRTYVGCYRTHLASPSAQATAPFKPFAIQSASIREVPNGSVMADLLATACPGP
ncbi:MAG: hypothetical protein M3Z65_01010 [Chloroflexota bacterium]|nr:hypothetical protein [Chloroflexota bacterium]